MTPIRPTSKAVLRFPGIHELTERDLPSVGGKAIGLSRLHAHGLPVPPGFVVPVDAFERRQHDRMHPADRDAVTALARQLASMVIVRSSATREDGRDRSWAGQHNTVPDVLPEGVPRAVETVWKSLDSPQASAYGQTHDATLGHMAAVVQRQIRARSSGVIFTRDPRTTSGRVMVIEAISGHGEDLVSGARTPCRWSLRRPWGPRFTRALPLRVIQSELSTETTPPLSDDALQRVARLGLRAERAFGIPVDVEWVLDHDDVLWVVQARAITTRVSHQAIPQTPLWTRRFIGERWPDPATPLGWSLIRPQLEHFIAYPQTQQARLGGGPMLTLVAGRPYINATVFRHLAFKAPGFAPPAFIVELLPTLEARAWRARHAQLPDLGTYGSLLWESFADRRWSRFAWNPTTNHLAWARFEPELRREVEAWQTPCHTLEEAQARVATQCEMVRRYIGIHIASLLFANLAWQGLGTVLGAALAGDIEPRRRALATCPPGNATLRTNRDLWSLAQRATEADLDRLDVGATPQPPFREALAAFLAEHGHRAPASWEVFSPRWKRHPQSLAPLLRACRGGVEDPAVWAHERRDEHERAVAWVRRHAPLAHRPAILASVWFTRRYLLLRENQRYAFDRLMDALQDTLLELGAHGVRDGWLDRADQIAFLTWDEVQAAIAGEHGTRDPRPVWRTREHTWRDQHDRHPPITLSDEERPFAAVGRRFDGQGVGGARVSGPARRLHGPQEALRLRPGDILVTRTLDPGWTPLLTRVAGAVVELGGMLSHGAVIAREYGVPMVVDLPGVWDAVEDGEWLTIDGTAGTVWRGDCAHMPGA